MVTTTFERWLFGVTFASNFVYLVFIQAYYIPKLWKLHKIERSIMVSKRRPSVVVALYFYSLFYFLIARPLELIPNLVDNPPSWAQSIRYTVPLRALGTVVFGMVLIRLTYVYVRQTSEETLGVTSPHSRQMSASATHPPSPLPPSDDASLHPTCPFTHLIEPRKACQCTNRSRKKHM